MLSTGFVTFCVLSSFGERSSCISLLIMSTIAFTVADLEGVQGVRSNPLPALVFKHHMKMK